MSNADGKVDQAIKDTFTGTSEDASTNSEKTTSQQKYTGPAIKKAVFLALLISIAVSCLTVTAYDRFFSSKPVGKDIVAIDIKGYVSDQQDLYIAGKLTDEQFKANLDYLGLFVKSVSKNKIILMGDAVVGGDIEVLKP